MLTTRTPSFIRRLLLLALTSAPTLTASATAAPSPRADGKPTRAEVKAKVAEIHKLLAAHPSDAQVEKACLALKSLGPLPRVQERLAELYLEAKRAERVTILHVLKRVGVANAAKALPEIARDYASARPRHPNDMSFAAYYVLERFLRDAWQKLPPRKGAARRDRKDEKGGTAKPVREDSRRARSPDGLVHPGSVADRRAIRRVIVDRKLNRSDRRTKQVFPVPEADDPDWVRVLGDHAFVRLRGESSGVDLLFIRSGRGGWSLLASLGTWVN